MPLNPAPYKIWEFDLSRARTDEPLGLSGTDIIVFKLTNPVEIRLDDIRNDKIPLTSCDPITPISIAGIPFKEIYLTNPSKKPLIFLKTKKLKGLYRDCKMNPRFLSRRAFRRAPRQAICTVLHDARGR